MNYKIGACYHPPYYPEDSWEEDIKKMKEIGLNFTRTGELIASWEWMEPEEGEIDWTWLDKYLNLCEKHDLRVILGTGSAGTPLWLYKKLKAQGDDIRIIDRNGHSYPLNAGWSWACPDHDNYLTVLREHIKTVVERYEPHPAVYGWQVSNEISYPFIKKEGQTSPELFCYCEETIKAFREWLKDRYDSLADLSRAWMWTPTNIKYGDWEQIEPPRAKSFEYGNFGAWLDWREFAKNRIEGFLDWQNEIVKSITDKPTMVNLFYFHEDDPFGAVTAMSPRRAARHVDALGVDVYPGDRQYREREYCSMHLNAGRDDAVRENREFWVPELQSGPIYGFLEGPLGKGTGSEIVRYLSETVAHGSELTLFMGWKDYPSLPMYWGGIVEMDGADKDITAEVAGRLTELEGWPEDSYSPPDPAAGIYLNERNSILMSGMGEQELLRQAVQGAYRLLYDCKIPVRFVRRDDFLNDDLTDLKLIIFPFTAAVNDKLLSKIEEYVKGGGSIVVTPQFGFFRTGSHRRANMDKALEYLLGSRQGQIAGQEAPEIVLGKDSFTGRIHRETIEPTREAKIMGEYKDGKPAVIKTTLGKGHVIRFGTHYDIAYYRDNNIILQDLMAGLLRESGVRPPFTLFNTNNVARNDFNKLDTHLLTGKEWGIISLINYAGSDITASIKYKQGIFRKTTGRGKAKDLSEKGVFFKVNKGGVLDLIYKLK